jgi:hypothetical protein
MRIWTVHPRYLDAQGLVALWREALLAKAVLSGLTRGYTKHPQLSRFRAQPDPVASINSYLKCVGDEALARGYRFDLSKVGDPGPPRLIIETRGQLEYEFSHLKAKLAVRSPDKLAQIQLVMQPEPNPVFEIIEGDIQSWEVGAARSF